ncbi:MAG: hypothetical protein V8R14_07670 [Clostridia bacterium]
MHKDISSFDFENSQDFYINEVYGVIVIDMSGNNRHEQTVYEAYRIH